MPLRCLSINGVIKSYCFDEDQWHELKLTYKGLDLIMPCCNEKAIPKTSKLGTFFFSHLKKGKCSTAPESKEHLLAKDCIARAVENAGWEALTEFRDCAPDGEVWIADILAQRKNVRIAFEIQVSRQTKEETVQRQNRYAQSNVRALWFFKQTTFPCSKEIPAFNLKFSEDLTDIQVRIPQDYWSHYDRKFDSWQQSINLEKFIIGALNRKLAWAPSVGNIYPITAYGAFIDCWKCKKKTRIIHYFDIDVESALPNHPNPSCKIYDFEDFPEILNDAFPITELSKNKVGRIKKRHSKTIGDSYVSNGCYHCDAIMGQFFDHDSVYDAEPFLKSKILLSEELIKKLDSYSTLQRWYFFE